VPYLSADPELTGYWRHLMGGANGYKIGLAWQGNPVQGNDRNRSFPVTHFESLARLDGVRLFSLQKAPGSEQLADLGERFSIADLGSRFRSFEDTAAALKNLDLIIAVDSVVAHCAGALGFPVWVLLPFAADWRWLTHRENSPWYPSMRLFRQPQPGGWDSVFARLVEELSKQLALARSPGGTEFRGWPSQTDIRKEVCDSEKELADSLRRAIQAQEQDEIEQAEAIYRQVLEKNPDNTTARNRLARICLASGRCDEALENYQKLLRLLPNQAALLNDKGIALTELGKLSEAISSFKQALNRNPHYGDVYNNLGLALAKEGLLEEAIVAFAQSLSLKPDNPEAYCNLGNVVLDLGRVEDAVANYRQSIRLKPNYAEAQMNLAMTWLLLGEFERGWLWYEWRWRMTGTASRDFVQPPWDGSALSGAKILLHAEQGLGDTLQFIRYAPLVKERGGFVIVECPGTLVPLLATCPGIDELIAYGTMPPAFDTHAPLMGLPRLFGTSMATIPAAIPYLSAACDLGEYWRRHLSEIGGFKVGAFWQGDPRHQKDRQRSIPLAAFGPLADVAGVQLCSLQKEPGTDQLACAAFPILDLASRFRNFADTAAALVNLDLVITVDSAVAHCAGALGVPVWVLLPYAPDWRWLLHREDSPWYPTMRLFRQEQPGDWEGVFRRVKAALEERLAARK
jgi:Tfp pilus assembly protein PilF